MSSPAEILSQSDISEHEKDKLDGEVVRYILFKSEQNSGCPIKREELTQLITAVGDAKSYIIISRLPSDVYARFVEDKSMSHMSGLTFVVVGIIHLGGGRIDEENLWHHLRRLGLHENEENHPVFSNTKQTLEALVQQRYLQKENVNGPEGNTVYYELAERALDAPINDRIKEYIAQECFLDTVCDIIESLLNHDYHEKHPYFGLTTSHQAVPTMGRGIIPIYSFIIRWIVRLSLINEKRPFMNDKYVASISYNKFQ
ncbi:hypothetical protein ACS0TY_015370 [Phlomoides rotata]